MEFRLDFWRRRRLRFWDILGWWCWLLRWRLINRCFDHRSGNIGSINRWRFFMECKQHCDPMQGKCGAKSSEDLPPGRRFVEKWTLHTLLWTC